MFGMSGLGFSTRAPWRGIGFRFQVQMWGFPRLRGYLLWFYGLYQGSLIFANLHVGVLTTTPPAPGKVQRLCLGLTGDPSQGTLSAQHSTVHSGVSDVGGTLLGSVVSLWV